MIDKSDEEMANEKIAQDKWSIGRPNVFNSLFGLVAIPLVFGYLVFVKLEVTLWTRLAILTAIWWGVLFIFWVLPIFSFFDAEKKWIARHNASCTIPAKKLIISAAFYFIYWPIYIPKEKAFWILFTIVGAYSIYKILGG